MSNIIIVYLEQAQVRHLSRRRVLEAKVCRLSRLSTVVYYFGCGSAVGQVIQQNADICNIVHNVCYISFPLITFRSTLSILFCQSLSFSFFIFLFSSFCFILFLLSSLITQVYSLIIYFLCIQTPLQVIEHVAR